MLNFRFHIVSLIAVFLALAIGIIMGSTVIDRALVDTLEDQQASLRADLDDLRGTNALLGGELAALRSTTDRLAEEGAERLLDGTLAGVPVLVIAVRGVEGDVVAEVEDLFRVAGAEDLGTLWLTGRLALEDEETVANLRDVLALSDGTSVDGLRSTAVRRLADVIRDGLGGGDADGGATPPDGDVPAEGVPTGDGADASLELVVALRDAGFVDYDAAADEPDDVAGILVADMRVVIVSGPGAEVADEDLTAPLARALVNRSTDVAPPVPVLAAEAAEAGADDADDRAELVSLLRSDDVQDRLSTVDNLDSFAGRLAAVIAVEDLGSGRRGHYGTGAGAQRLVPAPRG
jgi:hypothetical protein